jgi:hypothetical protein
MSRIRGWSTAWIVVLSVLAQGELARAADEPVTVVDIAPSAEDLDSAELRASIASELHARVVAPGDPLAPAAKGTLRVDVDRKSGHLTVTYVARSVPIARSIPLPDDRAAARTRAVLLAGNLRERLDRWRRVRLPPCHGRPRRNRAPRLRTSDRSDGRAKGLAARAPERRRRASRRVRRLSDEVLKGETAGEKSSFGLNAPGARGN